MSKNKNRGDFQKCFEMAKAFDDAAERCIENKEFFEGYVIYPFTVNAALACELYMKAIMMRHSESNEFSRGHLFDELFYELPEQAKIAIEEKYSKFGHLKFADMLNLNRNVFNKWRYAFEGEYSSVALFGLEDFMEALRQYFEETKDCNNSDL